MKSKKMIMIEEEIVSNLRLELKLVSEEFESRKANWEAAGTLREAIAERDKARTELEAYKVELERSLAERLTSALAPMPALDRSEAERLAFLWYADVQEASDSWSISKLADLLQSVREK